MAGLRRSPRGVRCLRTTAALGAALGLLFWLLPTQPANAQIDVSDPTAPVELWVRTTPGGYTAGTYDVEVVGEVAYAAVENGGLWVLDVSDSAAPVQLAYLQMWAFSPHDVEVVGGFAYIANGDGTPALRVIDVSNPAAPVEVGSLDTPHYAESIDVVGGLAYLTGRYTGLQVIDISNPTAPIELGVLDTPGRAYDVEVVGELAYVADGGPDYVSGLRVIDISNPAAPVEVGSLATPGEAYDVEVVDGFAYVADGGPGVRVIDVSDPTAPVEVGSLATPGEDRGGISVVGGLAYVGSKYSVEAFDVSNPAAPVSLGVFPFSGRANDVESVGGLVYVAYSYDMWGGLRLIDFGLEDYPQAPLPTLSPWSQLALMAGLLAAGLGVWRWREKQSSAA